MLVSSVQTHDRFGNFTVDVANRFQHPLAEVFGLVAVAQLERFVLAGGRAGRNRGAPPHAVPSARSAALARASPGSRSGSHVHIRLDRGIPARIEYLSCINLGDLRGHCCGHVLAHLLTRNVNQRL